MNMKIDILLILLISICAFITGAIVSVAYYNSESKAIIKELNKKIEAQNGDINAMWDELCKNQSSNYKYYRIIAKPESDNSMRLILYSFDGKVWYSDTLKAIKP